MKTTYENLSAPFVDADGVALHKWKMQTKSGVCVPYIDARQVAQRLNDVLGVENWSNTLIEITGEGIICEIKAMINGVEVTKSNIGTPGQIEKEKAMASDAFKRAAVHFGISAYLYEMEPVTLPVVQKGGKTYASTSDGKALMTGDQLTSYINRLHPMKAKMMEVYNYFDQEKRDKLSESFKNIWEAMS